MAGFSHPPTNVGAITASGIITENGGTSSAGVAGGAGGVTNPVPVSGAAFTPDANQDCMLYVSITATTAGTYALTMGPTTGAENAIITARNLVAASGVDIAVRVPAGWKVVVTLTGVTVAFGACTAVLC